MMECPCCGSSIERPVFPVDGLNHIRLTPKQRAILAAIVESYPKPVTAELLIEVLYGADPNGGPLTVRNVLAVHISRLRGIIEPYGWTVPTSRKGSGNAGLYRLEKINTAAQGVNP